MLKVLVHVPPKFLPRASQHNWRPPNHVEARSVFERLRVKKELDCKEATDYGTVHQLLVTKVKIVFGAIDSM